MTAHRHGQQLTRLRNLGPRSAQWLAQVGVDSVETLRAMGVAGCFERLLAAGIDPSINLAYAIQGALDDLDWRALPEHTRSELVLLVDALRAARTPTPARCGWCGEDPLYVRYHDLEWGVPVHEDRRLFEFLVLEGAQAGLSWITILRKREGYREAFADFDPARVAQLDEREQERLRENPAIVRNRAKIAATVGNAKAFLAIQREFGSFDDFLWRFVDGAPIVNSPKSLAEVPARTERSDALSRALQRRGFKFVGSTICYAYMQAIGMVNDHLTTCFRHPEAH